MIGIITLCHMLLVGKPVWDVRSYCESVDQRTMDDMHWVCDQMNRYDRPGELPACEMQEIDKTLWNIVIRGTQ